MEISEDKKKYDNKQYYQKFINKNKDKLTEHYTCDLCGGKYTYWNKYKHNATNKHIRAISKPVEEKQINNDILMQKLDEIKQILKNNNIE